MSLNKTDRLVFRLIFITFIYVNETQRDFTAKDYEIWIIQFYLVVTKSVLNNGRYKTPKKNILKYRLIVKALETLITLFFNTESITTDSVPSVTTNCIPYNHIYIHFLRMCFIFMRLSNETSPKCNLMFFWPCIMI
jgi:hypothetical protein